MTDAARKQRANLNATRLANNGPALRGLSGRLTKLIQLRPIYQAPRHVEVLGRKIVYPAGKQNKSMVGLRVEYVTSID